MKLILTLLLLITLLFPSQQRSQKEHADLIFHNGIIWTVDDKNPTAQAVAIKDGKFVVVGTNKAALKLRGPKTEVINLHGVGFVVPGFNDNHVHFASAAQFLEFNIMRVSSQQEFVSRRRTRDCVICPRASGSLVDFGAPTTNGPRAAPAIERTRTVCS